MFDRENMSKEESGMEEPKSNPERERLLAPMRAMGYEFKGYTNNSENEIWINIKVRKIFLYSIDNKEIVGPYDVKDKPIF
jgi:hypothetical protein